MGSFEEIQIGGESVFVAFNMKALFNFQRRTGVSLDKIGDFKELAEGVLDELIYQGLKEGHRLAKQPLTIEKENVLAIGLNDFTKYTDALTKSISTEAVQKKTRPKPIPTNK